jgi:hypothetical protein
MRSWWARVGVTLGFAIALARGVAIAGTPGDADADGVPDALDACPDTQAYELVGADGCSVCDCEVDANGEPWAARRDYVRCVVAEVRARRIAHAIGRTQARLALRAARNATCGGEYLVRCCIMFPLRAEGLCRVMDEMRCDAGLLHADEVLDLDAGSCLPNPCVQ